MAYTPDRKLLRLTYWVSSWVDMLCGFTGVVTFTLWRPSWDFKVRAWMDKKLLRRRIKRRENGNT